VFLVGRDVPHDVTHSDTDVLHTVYVSDRVTGEGDAYPVDGATYATKRKFKVIYVVQQGIVYRRRHHKFNMLYEVDRERCFLQKPGHVFFYALDRVHLLNV